MFFEKKRIFESVEKTPLRIRQEKAFPNGRDMTFLKRNGIWASEDTTTHWDELGRLVLAYADGGSRAFG